MAKTYRALYDENPLFKHYVDKYANTRGITIEIALTHKIIRQYAEYLGEKIDEE